MSITDRKKVLFFHSREAASELEDAYMRLGLLEVNGHLPRNDATECNPFDMGAWNMRVLILGGTRYFGKRLADLCLNSGFHVTVASTGKTKVNYVHPVEHVVVDRKNLSSMRTAFGNQRWDIVYDQICFSAEEATIAMEAFSGKIGQLVFTSTQSVYDSGVDLLESAFDPAKYSGETRNTNRYQEGKRLAEKVFAEQDVFPVTSVRFPIVLGRDDYTRRLHWHIARIKFGYPIFFPNPAAKLTVASSEDAAAFLLWLASKSLYGPVNACSPDALSMQTLIKTIELATGKIMLLNSDDSSNDRSPFCVEKDWCASPYLASSMGFNFSNSAEWLPLLVRGEVESTTIEDGKISGGDSKAKSL